MNISSIETEMYGIYVIQLRQKKMDNNYEAEN